MEMTTEAAQELANTIVNALSTASTPLVSSTDIIQYGLIGILALLYLVSISKGKGRVKDIVKELNDVQLKR